MMKHKDIYKKFMIEYDKALIASSYPSLTKYEVATMLDKAYLAIIAEKLTGNNPRRSAFETDNKAIEDIRPLIKRTIKTPLGNLIGVVSNEKVYSLPADMMYYLSAHLNIIYRNNAIDKQKHINVPVYLVNHYDAEKFKNTENNMPWIKNPVLTIEGDKSHVYYDSYKYSNNSGDMELTYMYIYKPAKFTDDSDISKSEVDFELSDTMAEEIINLAIIMSAEIVESPRMTSKSNIRPLES